MNAILLGRTGASMQSELFSAIEKGDTQALAALLTAGADPNARATSGTLRLLPEHGAQETALEQAESPWEGVRHQLRRDNR